MQLIPFIASSAAEAVTQIRGTLGPDAVVVHVRPLQPEGISRLWRKARFEVLAYRPETTGTQLDLRSDSPAQPDKSAARQLLTHNDKPEPASLESLGIGCEAGPDNQESGWQLSRILESSGFLAVNAQRVADQVQRGQKDKPAPGIPEQLDLAKTKLSEMWRRPMAPLEDTVRPHVLIGPPGAGKTTCLCKWLTQTVLVQGKAARVWRLDGNTANTAENLEIYCQALGVPVERSWRILDNPQDEVHFIDIPGVDWRNAQAVQELSRQVRSYLSPQVHVVLNGAYDTQLLLSQVRAFGTLPVEDLILTHLDEETRWGKFWNLSLGTNFPVRFLSAGQNIPGDFLPATPEQLFSRQFKSASR
ncbi:MAG: hypothetical protein RI897_226 [Verrucomicrobiota bacterium]|jgi:flagellar biosynthesis protein FlhF